MSTSEEPKKGLVDRAKEYTIVVNAREKQWFDDSISYEQIIVVSFGIYQPNDSTVYTVTYQRGDDRQPVGSMVKGDSIIVKNKMIFNVTATNKS